MNAPIVQADYEALDALARRFQAQQQQTSTLKQRVDRGVTALRNGGWQGAGSTAFVQEMESRVNPAMQRLIEALAEAQTVTLQLKEFIRQAEEAAASVFQGESHTSLQKSGDNRTPEGTGQNVAPGGLSAPSGYMMPTNPAAVTEAYWDNLTPEQQKYLHYQRNSYQTDLPQFEKDLVPSEWDNKGEAIAHNVGADVSGNIDYRGLGNRANQQAVYDVNGRLVTTPENMGTYDFVTPDQSIRGHWKTDVIPWIEWGNSPNDTTTREQRIAALKSTFWGRIGYGIYGPA